MSLEFLPPTSFGELDTRFFDSQRDAQIFGNQATGQPYDLVNQMPLASIDPIVTEYARGGAVHYKSSIAPDAEAAQAGSMPVPPIDRAFYFKVDDQEVGLWGFWGDESNPLWSFVVMTKSNESKMTLFDSNSAIYFEVLVKQGNSSLWGYTQSQDFNYKLLADNSKAALYAWNANDSNYITISTEHFPQDRSLVVQLREIEICEKDSQGNPMKMLVLCSEPYSDQ